MSITICERAVQPGETALVPKTKNRLVDLLYTIPVGMYTVYDVPCTQAESSANLGALTEDGGAFHLVMSIRSNVEYRHDQLIKKYRVICERNGAVLNVLNLLHNALILVLRLSNLTRNICTLL